MVLFCVQTPAYHSARFEQSTDRKKNDVLIIRRIFMATHENKQTLQLLAGCKKSITAVYSMTVCPLMSNANIRTDYQFCNNLRSVYF